MSGGKQGPSLAKTCFRTNKPSQRQKQRSYTTKSKGRGGGRTFVSMVGEDMLGGPEPQSSLLCRPVERNSDQKPRINTRQGRVGGVAETEERYKVGLYGQTCQLSTCGYRLSEWARRPPMGKAHPAASPGVCATVRNNTNDLTHPAGY